MVLTSLKNYSRKATMIVLMSVILFGDGRINATTCWHSINYICLAAGTCIADCNTFWVYPDYAPPKQVTLGVLISYDLFLPGVEPLDEANPGDTDGQLSYSYTAGPHWFVDIDVEIATGVDQATGFVWTIPYTADYLCSCKQYWLTGDNCEGNTPAPGY